MFMMMMMIMTLVLWISISLRCELCVRLQRKGQRRMRHYVWRWLCTIVVNFQVRRYAAYNFTI